MSVSAAPTRSSIGSRRVGYTVAVLVNAAMLWAVNVWPGWESLPFLSEEAPLVMSSVNLAIVVSLVANVVYLVHDPAWLKAAGDLVTLGVGVLALVRIWQVFPFELSSSPMDWALVVRILLVVGIVGSGIGMLVALVSGMRSVTSA
jgi:hypothetical protein